MSRENEVEVELTANTEDFKKKVEEAKELMSEFHKECQAVKNLLEDIDRHMDEIEQDPIA